jgi:hypothetical protein
MWHSLWELKLRRRPFHNAMDRGKIKIFNTLPLMYERPNYE